MTDWSSTRQPNVLRSVAEHQAVIAALITSRPVETLPLADAAGLVLAEDVHASAPLPPFDNSAMDGYAVRSADIVSATADRPVTLAVTADIPAGRVDGPPLAPATAHRIMTGAPMPIGADTVVQVEATDAGIDSVQIFASRPVGMHVRLAGEDVRADELVLDAGRVLGAAQLGLLAALGHASVSVHPRVRVLVLSTGSELVEPGQPLLHGQIHESNGIMLAAAIRAAGAHAEQLHFVTDDVAEFDAAIASVAERVDVVVTSGGVSAGAYEVVKDALSGRGVDFVKVAMQPGMPQGAGRVHDVAIVALPGNPVSALVSFEVFLRRPLRAAMGYTNVSRPVVRAVLAESVDSPAGKRQFRRGVLDHDTNTVRPIGPPGSHFLRWLASSDCLVDIAADVTHLDAGAVVNTWLLD